MFTSLPVSVSRRIRAWRQPWRQLAVALFLGLALTVAACGTSTAGGGGPAPTTTAKPSPSAAAVAAWWQERWPALEKKRPTKDGPSSG